MREVYTNLLFLSRNFYLLFPSPKEWLKSMPLCNFENKGNPHEF